MWPVYAGWDRPCGTESPLPGPRGRALASEPVTDVLLASDADWVIEDVHAALSDSDTTLRVGVVALNVDGYQLARCVAAAYVNTLKDKKGKRLWSIYKRTGGTIKDEFRLKDKVRTQRTLGVQTYEFVKEGDHDGRDVMSVDLQLAVCEEQGLPTKLGKG